MTAPTAVAPYEKKCFLYRALDPVHVGAGGYRLGRVDMTIVREPGTGIPKIPGTSLAGAARSYAALLYGKPEAAGAHPKHIGQKEKCPIIYTFGTASEAGGGRAGAVSIGDAQIVFFPVRSLNGSVMVTCPSALKDAGFGTHKVEENTVAYTGAGDKGLNLGWLCFDAGKVKDWPLAGIL